MTATPLASILLSEILELPYAHAECLEMRCKRYKSVRCLVGLLVDLIANSRHWILYRSRQISSISNIKLAS